MKLQFVVAKEGAQSAMTSAGIRVGSMPQLSAEACFLELGDLMWFPDSPRRAYRIVWRYCAIEASPAETTWFVGLELAPEQVVSDPDTGPAPL